MRSAAATIGSHLHRRKIYRAEGDSKIRNAIGARNRCRAYLGDRDSIGNERACVVQKIVLEADHSAILRGRNFESVYLYTFLGRTDEVFDSVLDVFDGASELH